MLLLLIWLRRILYWTMVVGLIFSIITIAMNRKSETIHSILIVLILCTILPGWIASDNLVRALTIKKKEDARK